METSETGAQNNRYYNMHTKRGGERGRERKRERGKKAFKTVKFMRATEPQIEIISLHTDK